MEKCQNVSHCSNVVDRRYWVRIGERVFCCNDCALEYLDVERTLAAAADPHNTNRKYVRPKIG
jgi:hypothetical protein